MSIEAYMKRRCVGTAVYWAPSTYGSDGSPTFATPVEIRCLWSEMKRLFRDTEGREIVSRATVYVLQDMANHGMLYKGELADLSAAQKSDPRKVTTAYEIKDFIKTPSMHLTDEYNRRAIL